MEKPSYKISARAGHILSECLRLTTDSLGLFDLFEDVFYGLDDDGDELYGEIRKLTQSFDKAHKESIEE